MALFFLQSPASSPGILDNTAQITNVVWDSINGMLAGIVGQLPLLIAGLLVAVIFYFLARAIRAAFLATTTRTNLDARLRILFSRLIMVFVVVLGFFTALTVVVPTFGFGDLIAGVGFTTFVVGFATKDILTNLLSGVLILWQSPFKLGDQIFVGKISGKVENIGVRATSLRQDNGELVLIPNGCMYTETLVIRGAGVQRRMTLEFKIGYSEDVDRVKAAVCGALEGTDQIVKEPAPGVLATDLAPEGINLVSTFWIDTNKVIAREALDAAVTNVMRALNKRGVEPYPPGAVVVLSPERGSVPESAPQTDGSGSN